VPLKAKTADAIATALYEEVIVRTCVPTSILSDRGGEFIGEVVQRVCERLVITHLKTSDYRPQTDAKCERVHFSVHNMIIKLIGSKLDRWLDLLGTVAFAYNNTVHTSTGFAPHNLFYTFSSLYALDAMIDGPVDEPVNNADQYALQATERLRESFHFVREYSGKQTDKMKLNYDASINQKSFKEGAYVLLFSPRKRRGTFSRWQVTWLGPYRITKKLNEANYILQKSPRSKGFVVHGDRLKPYHGNIDCKLWPLNSDKEHSQPRQETAQLLEQQAVGGQSNSQSTDDHWHIHFKM